MKALEEIPDAAKGVEESIVAFTDPTGSLP
jgi:hypothetical protein